MRIQPRFPSLLEVFYNRRRAAAVVEQRAEQQLRRIVRWAYERVPLYREHWRRHGFHPSDFRGRRDLPAIPPVDKDLIVDAGPAALAQMPAPRRIERMSTSGTSGRQIHALRTGLEMRVMRRALLRQLVAAGARPWLPVMTLASMWLNTRRGTFIQKFCKTRFLPPESTLDEQVAAVQEFQPLGLIGQTGGIYLLARELLRRGLRHPLRFLMPTGATLMPEMRQTMRDAFQLDARDMYGAIELGVIATQCAHGGYHIDADRVAFEIVDSDGRPVPRGRQGQVICTSLYGYYMPFIRYRLLDIAAVSTRRCPCGCRLPLMDPVQGRVNDFLPTPRGDLVTPHFFFHLFDAVGDNPVKDWRLTQESLHELVYEYVPDAAFTDHKLEHGLGLVRKRFGESCTVRAVRRESIPLSAAGKRNCILSKLRPNPNQYDRPWVGAVVRSAELSKIPAQRAAESEAPAALVGGSA